MKATTIRPFSQTLADHQVSLKRETLQILQINIGKLCNQACHHCHVEAGPNRKENMEKNTVERILVLLQKTSSIHTVDLTGGAPELNPHFRHLVNECRKLGKNVIDRCNLTVFFEPGHEDTAEFLKKSQVQVVASLPCYSKENVERQRGNGVFDKSIRAIHQLNDLGYGKEGSNLILNLVYNPLGAFLPPAQEKLEKAYKQELWSLFGVEFNRLFTLTNMPIKRFLSDLERNGRLQEYMELLTNNFKIQAALGVMCRTLVSVSWDGYLYDCDFNQMLNLGLNGKKKTLWDIENFNEIERESMALSNHCYGCTAGAGSSCSGALN